MGSWIVFAVQVTLSLLTLSVAVLSFVWLRSNARDGRETKLLLERIANGFHPTSGDASAAMPPAWARHGGAAPAPMALDTMTDSRRSAGLTIAMARPEVQRQLAVQIGAEIVALDAETVARIEALREDVNAGRLDGSTLQRVIEAGLGVAVDGVRESGDHGVASNDVAPITPVPPTRPTGN
jgi:hypothetical protein